MELVIQALFNPDELPGKVVDQVAAAIEGTRIVEQIMIRKQADYRKEVEQRFNELLGERDEKIRAMRVEIDTQKAQLEEKSNSIHDVENPPHWLLDTIRQEVRTYMQGMGFPGTPNTGGHVDQDAYDPGAGQYPFRRWLR